MQKEIEFFRKEYQKQKVLEQLVNSRNLNKPNTKKWHVTASFVILPFLLLGIGFVVFNISISTGYQIAIFILAIITFFETYARFCCLLCVKCYQHYAKDETRKRCKCIPSCSEYAIICLKRIFPLVLALLKIRKRLFVTCKGKEYIIDFPSKKMEKNFENTLL